MSKLNTTIRVEQIRGVAEIVEGLREILGIAVIKRDIEDIKKSLKEIKQKSK